MPQAPRTLNAIGTAITRASGKCWLTDDDVAREALLASMDSVTESAPLSGCVTFRYLYSPNVDVLSKCNMEVLSRAATCSQFRANTPSSAQAIITHIIPTRQIAISYDLISAAAPQIESPDRQEISPEEEVIRTALMQPAGSTTRERFAFSTLIDYLEKQGGRALEVLRDVILSKDSPSTTRYYGTLILGYVNNRAIHDVCYNLLLALKHNSDAAIRTGAEDALAYLQSP